jgi:hypothetical protein
MEPSHWHSRSHQNSLWSIVDKGFSDDHQHHLRWCKVVGLMERPSWKNLQRMHYWMLVESLQMVYRICWHHWWTKVILKVLQQKSNIPLGPLHHYSSCLHWVWTIPHFISCSSQFSASSSMSEHISSIQWLMYLSMWGTCPSSLCQLSCPIVELVEQDDLSNLQQ